MENTPTTSNKPYLDHGIKWGLILGGIIVLLKNIPWFISVDAAMKSGGGLMWLLYVLVFIGMLVFIGIKARKITGYITSRQAFRSLMVAVLAYCALGYVANIVVYTINKEAIEQKMAEVRDETYTKLEEKGMSDEQIEKQMKWFEWFKPGIGLYTMYFILATGFDILIALIIAQFIKKNPPYTPPVVPETT